MDTILINTILIIILLIIICTAICCWSFKPKRYREKCMCALIMQEYRKKMKTSYRKKMKTSERDGVLPC